MQNHDQQIDLAQGSDSGTDEAESVQPIGQNEHVWPTLTNRPTEHLRRRTERLRRAGEDLLYLADYDRALVLRAGSAFTFTEPASGEYALTIASGDLWVYPALTPGRQSGGRHHGGRVFCENSAASGAWTPYSGTPGVDDLLLTADRRYTGQRGYADADSFADTPGARSLGANRIVVDLVADGGRNGGVGTMTATITKRPQTKIRIEYGTAGTPTTLADVIAFVNGDRTSQGAFGVADFLRASSTGATTNTPTPFTGGRVQGAYDAEAHQITKAQLDAFFAVQVGGVYVNRLREGEALAVAYPMGLVERSPGSPDGGRRQAVWDLPTDRTGARTQNTTPAVGYSLFSTGREPEKIPGSIPIGKVIDGEFVFLDGTRLGVGDTLRLGDSRVLRAELAAQTLGADGAALIGYEGSGNWHADAAATTGPNLPASTVTASITRIVAHLASAVTNQSAARRIGVEQLPPVVSPGNEDREVSVGAGSLRQTLNTLLNGLDGSSRLIGLNGRVSELGHRMVGGDALYKDFDYAGMPAAGGVFTRAELHAPDNLVASTPLGVDDHAHLVLQPLVFNNGSGTSLAVNEAAEVGGAAVIHFTAMTSDRFTKVVAYLPIVTVGGDLVPLVYARVTGLNGGAGNTDGFFVVKSHNTSNQTLTLQLLDGGAPNLSAAGALEVTLYSVLAIGNDKRYARLNLFHLTGTSAAKRSLVNVGVGDDTQPVLEVYAPSGNTGTRLMRVSPKEIEIEGKALNATKIGAIQEIVFEEAILVSGLAPDFTTPNDTLLSAPAAGRTLRGVYVRLTATVKSAAAGVVRYVVNVGRAGAALFPVELSVEWTAAAGGEARYASVSGFVPFDPTATTPANNERTLRTTLVLSVNTSNDPPFGVAVYGVGRVLGFT